LNVTPSRKSRRRCDGLESSITINQLECAMSRRIDRVNELLKREISSVVQRDFEFVGSLVTVNAVEVAQDLKDAKVYIGVLGGHEDKVISRLNVKHGFIQARVMKRVVLKNTPILRFVSDHSVERGVDMVNLLDQVSELPTASPEENEEEE
jgi:ribosome-binding factor A